MRIGPALKYRPSSKDAVCAGAGLFAGGAAADGEDAAARPSPRFEHAAVEAGFAKLVRGGHPGQTGTENHDAHATDAAGEAEGLLRRRGEKAEGRHRLVGERGAAGGGNTCQESSSRDSHRSDSPYTTRSGSAEWPRWTVGKPREPSQLF